VFTGGGGKWMLALVPPGQCNCAADWLEIYQPPLCNRLIISKCSWVVAFHPCNGLACSWMAGLVRLCSSMAGVIPASPV